MILIAHRGNINGPNPEQENRPEYINEAVEQGYDVELDVRLENNKWFLGHDESQYEIELDFILRKGLWIHCKNHTALRTLLKIDNVNVFYCTNEEYVLTSQNVIWAFPGIQGDANTVCVMPEYHNTPTEGSMGICSDYIGNYKND
jgi:hypothetical protein